ncbi:LytR C-terminal domain-containing protein [Bifidobacterium sp. ESL0763]|nr:LytR C-terminal domain-containing protein [Bifidobacterium sp. ESL0763]MDF7663092.1 LytR C-terminal domain-containing protein [Bifidobacterium sp. ESL0763]
MDEREARRQYVRHRQTRVILTTIAAMVVVLIIALLMFFHVFGIGIKKTTAAEPNFGATSVCAPVDQSGAPAKYPQNTEVKIRVLNGTKFVGFAKAVGEALSNRHFTVTNVSNYTSQKIERTTIYYGVNSIDEAYTLNSNFNDAKMVMDNRQDKLVDVIVGATFNDLNGKKHVPAPGTKIKNIQGCTPLKKVNTAKLPQAIAHDAA